MENGEEDIITKITGIHSVLTPDLIKPSLLGTDS
jgi:hypothetical protein